MSKKRLLIVGDSFAADWTIKTKEYGWVNFLQDIFIVTNIAQAGCSEYKILKQLKSKNLKSFDSIIVSHTSPYRLYTSSHPVHHNDALHKNSCFIYNDVVEHVSKYPELKPVIEYFDRYFDTEHAEHTHNLLLKEIEELCPKNTLHISHIEWKNLHTFKNFLNFKDVFAKHRGSINHYDDVGNKIVLESVLKKLEEINE